MMCRWHSFFEIFPFQGGVVFWHAIQNWIFNFIIMESGPWICLMCIGNLIQQIQQVRWQHCKCNVLWHFVENLALLAASSSWPLALVQSKGQPCASVPHSITASISFCPNEKCSLQSKGQPLCFCPYERYTLHLYLVLLSLTVQRPALMLLSQWEVHFTV